MGLEEGLEKIISWTTEFTVRQNIFGLEEGEEATTSLAYRMSSVMGVLEDQLATIS